MKATTKDKIIYTIIIITAIIVIYAGLFLALNWLDSNNGCYCGYDIYLPPERCWGVCNE